MSSPVDSCGGNGNGKGSGKGKGKARATVYDTANERTPLIYATSSSSTPALERISYTHAAFGSSAIGPSALPASSSRRPAPLRRLFRFAVLSTLVVFFVLILLVLLLAWKYGPQTASTIKASIDQWTTVEPVRVEVVRVIPPSTTPIKPRQKSARLSDTQDVLRIQLKTTLRIGVDVGGALQLGPGSHSDGPLDSLWKYLTRWGVRKLGRVSVRIGRVTVFPAGGNATDVCLATIPGLPPIEIPLSVRGDSQDKTWLEETNIQLFVDIPSDASSILNFAEDAWKHTVASAKVEVEDVRVSGGYIGESGWRATLVNLFMEKIARALDVAVPNLPGLPPPGSPLPPFDQLVTLQEFSISSEEQNLRIDAIASVLDPIPTSIHTTIPSLPFIISLFSHPSTDTGGGPTVIVPIADVKTPAVALTHPNITLPISGSLVPLSDLALAHLSAFISTYLSGEPNKVLISTPLLPSLPPLVATFPAPSPKPKVLRQVGLEDMKIKPLGSGFVASGTVKARVTLPKGIDVDLDVRKVFPDVLIFDGPVDGEEEDIGEAAIGGGWYPHLPGTKPAPTKGRKKPHHGPGDEDDDEPVPPSPPLPSPLPSNAFGHLRPESWVPSSCVPSSPTPEEAQEGVGNVYDVEAEVVDVPVHVLPGRQKQFSNFVGKVIFGTEGALAGIQGVAAVKAVVKGMPSGDRSTGIMLQDLPFQGSVVIGKKGLA